MKYKINTITRTLPADLQTPVGIYLKVRDLYPQSALLESSDYHTTQNSFSFIGIGPMAAFMVKQNRIICSYPDGKEKSMEITPQVDVINELKKYIGEFDTEKNPTGVNGFFGFTAYDCVQYFESVDIQAKEDKFAEIPDMKYILYRYILVVNHFRSQMTVVENLAEHEVSRMDGLLDVIRNNNIAQYKFEAMDDVESPVTDDEYMGMVKEGIRHTRRGDVFQIVLSRRFSQGFRGDDFNVYRNLRCINPSPYLFYFDFGSFRIFGSSPETHLRVSGGKAFIDPIAGTFKRTGDDLLDSGLARQLLEDEKEIGRAHV